ncbi:A-kinase-interacting protein 1 [Emydura macquarii macquarii]|uniref:A-kinase-interacting protein 1 n=1 Tax=Emydura macquarii macquarii TaxID=1129001 RepID=UPI00352B7E72
MRCAVFHRGPAPSVDGEQRQGKEAAAVAARGRALLLLQPVPAPAPGGRAARGAGSLAFISGGGGMHCSPPVGLPHSLPPCTETRMQGMESRWPARGTRGIMQPTAGLALEVLERAKRRKVRWPEPAEEDSERLNAAFASIVEFMSQTTKECEKYYSYVPASRCRENEIKHICRYHSRQAAENLLQTLEEEKNENSPVSNPTETPKQPARKASKDLYIEVSPGTYSVTATSEDMVKQTHVVDVNAGQSIDLTFSI